MDLSAGWRLDPDVVFLNHGSFGSTPECVLQAQAEWRARMERRPVRFFQTELEAAGDRVRGELGALVGADPDDLALVSNATMAVNAVLRSLPFEPGDEILTTDHAYNAVRNAIQFVADRTGATVRVAPVPCPVAGADEAFDAILAAVTPRTRLAVIDAVTSPTALVLPIERLVAALRERGVETLVDGAHAVGMLELDLDGLGAAYFTSNAHKWLCAPKGCAFLHVRRDLQDAVRPLAISHGANSMRTDRSRYRLEFDWMGTSDPTAHLALPDAIAFLERARPDGLAGVRARNRALALEGRATIAAAAGLEVVCPAEMVGSLATFRLPPARDPALPTQYEDALQDRLVDVHGVQVPVMLWRAHDARYLRISAQLYNEPADYQHLARALVTELDRS